MSLGIIIGRISSIIIESYWLMMHGWVIWKCNPASSLQSNIVGKSTTAISFPKHDRHLKRSMVPFSKIYNKAKKQPWRCRNPGFVRWTRQLLVVLISEKYYATFLWTAPLAATHHCRCSFYRIPFNSSAIRCTLYKHSKLGNVFHFLKGLTLKYPYNTIWYLST